MSKSKKKAATPIEFTAEVYRDAALERAGSLQPLYDEREYVLAIYVAGVAVESMFRAYRCQYDPEFSSRHDLYELAKESRFAERVPDALFAKYAADLGVVGARWSNAHRYRSEAALRRYIKRVKLDRGVKGDALKENARRIINAAFDLVTLGARIWKR